MSAPTFSVIITAYNRAHYIEGAIASIIGQTFPDFELIVVDDGSTDATSAKVRAIGDPRVRLVEHPCNRGIPAARNTGLDHARGQFIAWLDSDDLARPHRLAEQLGYLQRHPDVAMVGSCAGKIGPSGKRLRGTRVPPLLWADIGAWLLFRSPFQQSSIAGRTEILQKYRYRNEFQVCEDLDMFIRISQSHRVENLPRVLVDRRLHEDQSIRLHSDLITDSSLRLLAPRLEDLAISFSSTDLENHVFLGKPWAGAAPDRLFLEWADDWMSRIRQANQRSRLVDFEALHLATSFFWMLTCNAAKPALGLAAVTRKFASSRLSAGLLNSHSRAWFGNALMLLVTGG